MQRAKPTGRYGYQDWLRVSRQRSVFVSLVNAFTNYRDVKGCNPRNPDQVSKVTHCLSGFMEGTDLNLRQPVTNLVRYVSSGAHFRYVSRVSSVRHQADTRSPLTHYA